MEKIVKILFVDIKICSQVNLMILNEEHKILLTPLFSIIFTDL